MAEAKFELSVPNIRVFLLGDANVGKKTLLSRFTSSKSANASQRPITDANPRVYSNVTKKVNGRSVTFSVAASELVHIYEPIDVAFFVYDISNIDSLKSLQERINSIRRSYPDCKLCLMGNKADLQKTTRHADLTQLFKQVDSLEDLNRIVGAAVVSATDGSYVDEAFFAAARMTMGWQEEAQSAPDGAEQKGLQQDATPPLPTKLPTPYELEQMATPDTPKRSCSALFWAFMAHPAVTAIGILILLAGTAALLAATYGTAGVAIAGALTIAGSTAVATGGVSTLLSIFGICKTQGCSSKGQSNASEASNLNQHLNDVSV